MQDSEIGIVVFSILVGFDFIGLRVEFGEANGVRGLLLLYDFTFTLLYFCPLVYPVSLFHRIPFLISYPIYLAEQLIFLSFLFYFTFSFSFCLGSILWFSFVYIFIFLVFTLSSPIFLQFFHSLFITFSSLISIDLYYFEKFHSI